MSDFRFKITEGSSVTYTEWFAESTTTPTQEIEELRWEYPTASFQIERGTATQPPMPSPIPPAESYLINDPDPTLSADLKLNTNAIVGRLETDNLEVDGGLL